MPKGTLKSRNQRAQALEKCIEKGKCGILNTNRDRGSMFKIGQISSSDRNGLGSGKHQTVTAQLEEGKNRLYPECRTLSLLLTALQSPPPSSSLRVSAAFGQVCRQTPIPRPTLFY